MNLQVSQMLSALLANGNKQSDWYLANTLLVRHGIAMSVTRDTLAEMVASGLVEQEARQGVPFYSLPVHNFAG